MGAGQCAQLCRRLSFMRGRAPLLTNLAQGLARGDFTSLELTEASLSAIAAASAAGDRSLIAIQRSEAIQAARAADAARMKGARQSPIAGVPIAIKDNIDQAGERTRAGSVAAQKDPPVASDSGVVARLRQAGAIVVGRTNMVEFAYSGLGLNPHYGTPENPAAPGRIPGGSSSGSAALVAQGAVSAAIGTDTAGSIRVPAAFCGLVGFKPTQRRVTRTGVFPLAPSLDTVGPMASSVRCCAILDAILASDTSRHPLRAPGDIRLAIPSDFMTTALDETVSRAFSRSLDRLSRAGVRLQPIALGLQPAIDAISRGGRFVDAEAATVHADRFARHRGAYDPRVAGRIERGLAIPPRDHRRALRERVALIRRFDAALADFDALVAPTVPIVPPRLEEVGDDLRYGELNARVLSNTIVANLVDGCSISVPCHEAGELPVGIMLTAPAGRDASLLACAERVEAILGRSPRDPPATLQAPLDV